MEHHDNSDYDDDGFDCIHTCDDRYPSLRSDEDIEGLVHCYSSCFDKGKETVVKEAMPPMHSQFRIIGPHELKAREECLDTCDEQTPVISTDKDYFGVIDCYNACYEEDNDGTDDAATEEEDNDVPNAADRLSAREECFDMCDEQFPVISTDEDYFGVVDCYDACYDIA